MPASLLKLCGAISNVPGAKTCLVSLLRTFPMRPSVPLRKEPPVSNVNLAMLGQPRKHPVTIVATLCERLWPSVRAKFGGRRPPLQPLWLLLVWLCCLFASWGSAQTLNLPARPLSALTGSQLVTNAAFFTTNLIERETFICSEILSGNIPSFLRKLCPVFLTDFGTSGVNLEIYVMPNYLAIGSDDDYRFMPMTPATAQCIADASGCILPTRKMVDVIYESAAVKLSPQPLTPGATMTTPLVFFQH